MVAPLSVTSVRAESESSRALARSLFQDLIAINTTDSVGNVTIAAAATAKRLRAADDNGQVQDKASDRKGFPLPPLDREVMKPLESHNESECSIRRTLATQRRTFLMKAR